MRTPIRPRRAAERGSALLVAVLMIMLVGALAVGHLHVAQSSHDWANSEAQDLRLETAAESVAALTINELWSRFVTEYPESNRSRWDLRHYLDDLGMDDVAPKLNELLDSPVAGHELKSTLGELHALESFQGTNLLTLPHNERGHASLSDIEILGVDIWRQDTFNSTHLIVEATVQEPFSPTGDATGATVTAREVFTITEPDWGGLDFAILANNINCVMCHTRVDNAFRFYNRQVSREGSFGRVRVGSLESFQIRHDPHSLIAGTLYLNGTAVDEDGRRIDAWEGLSLDSAAFDDVGYLEEDAWGELLQVDMTPASPFDPPAFANLYLDYGDHADDPPDGMLPESFPAPFPDDGGYDFVAGQPVESNAGNRKIDDSEFALAVASSTGSVSGSNVAILPPGASIEDAEQLQAYTDHAGRGEIVASTAGTVFLHGTKDDPIRLDGNIAIDGDLVIHGYVDGLGSLNVRGNVYIPSDLVYADGTDSIGNRTYAYNAVGQQNGLAIAAGGNMLVGDFFHSRFAEEKRTTGKSDGSFNFIMEELAIFNRAEWMKTQPTLPGKRKRVRTGEREVTRKVYERERETYMKEVPVYERRHNGLPEPYGKVEKIKVGTKLVERKRWVNVGEPELVTVMRPTYKWTTPQHTNPFYEGASYIPRYYTFTEDSTIVIANKDGHFDGDSQTWIGRETVDGWNRKRLTMVDPTDEGASLLFGPGGEDKAVVTHLTSTSGWISDELLETFLASTLAERETEEPFEIDAILYSNNSIFGITPARDKPGADGRLRINGSIVAADIGLLAPVGFEVNYDSRGRSLLNLQSDRGLTIRRVAWLPPGQ